MPRRDDLSSILILGSGPIVIGQAAEFDYAGTQACRALMASVEGERVDAASGGVWYRPMVARPTDEEHRSATVLELFFDLCFVVAVAQAASALHHEVAEDHVGDGVVGYAMVFFAIWWAWMNFTWFASAYDTDDIPYRLTTLVQIAGALILAAGVPEAMASSTW